MSGEEMKIELGFEGGSGVHVLTDSAHWEQLQTAMKNGSDEWVTLHGKDDADYLISVGKITYARVASQVRSIGFRE